MDTKAMLYHHLGQHIAHCGAEDVWLAETHPAQWRYARQLDDWLTQTRADERVSGEEYAEQCDRLMKLYRDWHEVYRSASADVQEAE